MIFTREVYKKRERQVPIQLSQRLTVNGFPTARLKLRPPVIDLATNTVVDTIVGLDGALVISL